MGWGYGIGKGCRRRKSGLRAARVRAYHWSMQTAALIVVIMAGFWLIAVGLLMAVRPRLGLRLCETMAAGLERSSWRVQYSEQGLRVLAGAALIVRAPASKLPLLFEMAGWILVVTSLLIMVAPISWHAAYGRLLLKRLTPLMLRTLSPIPALAGTGLIYAAL